MNVIIETVILCSVLFLICFLETGTDEKNLLGLRSYPTDVQNIIRSNEKYKDKTKETNIPKVFIANLVMFMIVLLVFGIFIKSDDFRVNFINILILGEALNLFDFVIIDLIWWRNTKRIRFSEIPDKKMYQNPKKHIDSFLRGIIMYGIIAVIDGFILTIL
ncbi:ABC transporter permease [Massilicoli timonensis]|uniref:ABC transporter permease n=1 Tax=Massilicoli timonensis TaxID=2015901 RepID=UPI000C847EC5|nr:ABC transporter permease [Massilicoli timonensis]